MRAYAFLSKNGGLRETSPLWNVVNFTFHFPSLSLTLLPQNLGIIHVASAGMKSVLS